MARDTALLILRLGGLYLALGHGLGKVLALAAGESGFADGVAALGFPLHVFFAWAASLAELAGGIAIALGLFTRWAAGLAAVTMFVATFAQHRALSQLLAWLGLAPATEETLKAWGNPELATLYLVVAVAVLLLGPGRISIDATLRGRWKRGAQH